MGKSQRTKGATFEREIVKAFKELGFDFSRNLDQWRDGGGDISTKRWMFECKRRAKISIYEWMEQCVKASKEEQIPVVIARGDNKEALAILKFSDFIGLFHVLERSAAFAEKLEAMVEADKTKTLN